jgi:hypothetical protein
VFFIRLLTAAICFGLLFCFFYLGGSMLIGMVVGVDVAMENDQSHVGPPDVAKIKAEAKQEAQAEEEAHIRMITLTAVVLSGLCSLGLAFGRVLPWCRKKPPAVAESG